MSQENIAIIGTGVTLYSTGVVFGGLLYKGQLEIRREVSGLRGYVNG